MTGQFYGLFAKVNATCCKYSCDKCRKAGTKHSLPTFIVFCRAKDDKTYRGLIRQLFIGKITKQKSKGIMVGAL